MKFPSKEFVESIRKQYPVGCRVELLRMEDIQAPTVGKKAPCDMSMTSVPSVLRGTTEAPSKWYTAKIYAESWRMKIMDKKVKEQILAVRDTGLTNMFDTRAVQRIAFDTDFFELVAFLEEHKDKYVRFILTGEE